MDEVWEVRARAVVRGIAVGPALVSPQGLSFLGDLDITTGTVVNRESSIVGESVSGTVLILPRSVGSAGAWRVLYQLSVHRTSPAAIITMTPPDPSLVQGAILAGVPIVSEPVEDLAGLVGNGALVRVDGTLGVIRITRRDPT